MIEATLENSYPVPTVIVSRPGIMQQSLRASLAANSWITVVASCGDGLTALNRLARYQPGLMVIDSNLLDEEVEALLTAVKARYPAIRCLVLVRTLQHKDQLLVRGADAVIQRNATASELTQALTQLAQDVGQQAPDS